MILCIWIDQFIFLLSSSTMNLSGTFKLLSSLILSCFIFSKRAFWPWKVSFSCWFSTSIIFFSCFLWSSFSTICFFNSRACFISNSFLSFSSFYYSSLTSFCLRMTYSNSAFSALACSSSILSFSLFCYSRACWSSADFFARISASIRSFSRADLSLASAALLALRASSSACRSEAFSWSSLNFWIYFSFSSLIRFCSARTSASFSAFSLI